MSRSNNTKPTKNPKNEKLLEGGDYQPFSGNATYDMMPEQENETPLQASEQQENYAPLITDEQQNTNEDVINTPDQDAVEDQASLTIASVTRKDHGANLTTEMGEKYKIYDRLSDNQSEKLRKQTLLQRQHSNTILGKGHFGSVLVAKQKLSEADPGKFLAVKVIKNDASLFEKENQFYSVARERNIEGLLIPLETIRCAEDDTIYQFMPIANFGDGNKLIQVMSDHSQKDKDVVLNNIALQILHAFEDMHSKHVYHLDFKPDNFLIDFNGKAWVSDFGSAMAYDDQGKPVYTSLQTVTDSGYWPPDIYLNTVSSDEELHQLTDQWRLGLTLLQLVCHSDENIKFISQYILVGFKKLQLLTTEEQKNYFDSLHIPIEDLLETENVSVELSQVIKGLLKPNPVERMRLKTAISILQQSKPQDSAERTRDIFLGFAPKEQTQVLAPPLLVTRKDLRRFSELVHEVSEYKDRHAKSHVIDIAKKQVADRVLEILSTRSTSDPAVVVELKDLIAKGEVTLRHQHFHSVKKWLGKDVEVIAKAKKMVVALEGENTFKKPANQSGVWYKTWFNTIKNGGNRVLGKQLEDESDGEGEKPNKTK